MFGDIPSTGRSLGEGAPIRAAEARDADAARAERSRAAFMKAAWRLVPFVTVGYLVNYMDRNNVGFAALTMNRDTGLTATEFGWAERRGPIRAVPSGGAIA